MKALFKNYPKRTVKLQLLLCFFRRKEENCHWMITMQMCTMRKQVWRAKTLDHNISSYNRNQKISEDSRFYRHFQGGLLCDNSRLSNTRKLVKNGYKKRKQNKMAFVILPLGSSLKLLFFVVKSSPLHLVVKNDFIRSVLAVVENWQSEKSYPN